MLNNLLAMQSIEGSFLARELAHGKAPAFVELLKFKVGCLCSLQELRLSQCPVCIFYMELVCCVQTCNVGARVWGVVSDITHHGITVSLPDGLKGHVSVEEVQHYCLKSWQGHAS